MMDASTVTARFEGRNIFFERSESVSAHICLHSIEGLVSYLGTALNDGGDSFALLSTMVGQCHPRTPGPKEEREHEIFLKFRQT